MKQKQHYQDNRMEKNTIELILTFKKRQISIASKDRLFLTSHKGRLFLTIWLILCPNMQICQTSRGFIIAYSVTWASLVAQLVKNLSAMCKTWVQSLGWEDPLEKGKAIHSSILAWRIPWIIQSMGSQRVGHNWATFMQSYSMQGE